MQNPTVVKSHRELCSTLIIPHSHHVFCITFLQVDGINSNQMSAAMRLLGFNKAPQSGSENPHHPWLQIIAPLGYHYHKAAILASALHPQNQRTSYPPFHNHGSVENGCISNMIVSFHFPIGSIYGIFTNIYQKYKPKFGEHIPYLHGSYLWVCGCTT